jgi:hypothetical protein
MDVKNGQTTRLTMHRDPLPLSLQQTSHILIGYHNPGPQVILTLSC